ADRLHTGVHGRSRVFFNLRHYCRPVRHQNLSDVDKKVDVAKVLVPNRATSTRKSLPILALFRSAVTPPTNPTAAPMAKPVGPPSRPIRLPSRVPTRVPNGPRSSLCVTVVVPSGFFTT